MQQNLDSILDACSLGNPEKKRGRMGKHMMHILTIRQEKQSGFTDTNGSDGFTVNMNLPRFHF